MNACIFFINIIYTMIIRTFSLSAKGSDLLFFHTNIVILAPLASCKIYGE